MTGPATEARLDLARNDVAIHLAGLALRVHIAQLYADSSIDDRLGDAMSEAETCLRAAMAALRKLQQARADAEVAGEAAEEWRQQRGSRAG